MKSTTIFQDHPRPHARYVGRFLRHYPITDSTNERAIDLWDRAEEGWAILADEQTAGRGQYGRTWYANPSESVLMSMILSPPEFLRRPALLCALAAVAVRRSVFALTQRIARFKWPNDLLVDDRKICGILVEHRTVGGKQAAVVGVGLNLNQTADTFAERHLPQAGSLRMIVGNTFDSFATACVLLDAFDLLYSEILTNGFSAWEREWSDGLALQGRSVRVECVDGRELRGYIESLSFDTVELRLWSGEILRLEPERISHLWPLPEL